MASKNIKGITIEIGGDTTKLDKALSGVEKTSKEAKQELREIEKSIEKNPDNLDLWKQKQEVLNKSLQASKDKLKLLVDTQEQMNEKLKNGEISGEQYRAFQRELANTRSEVEQLQQAAESCSPHLEVMASKGEKLKSFGNDIAGAGEAMLGVTAAVAGIATASVAAYDAMDSGYDIIVKKTGATDDALKSLTDSMDKIFSEIPTDAETAGTAIGEVNTRFGLMGEELETLSEQFIKFAEINDADVNTSIDNIDSLLKKFNMDSSEASDVLDMLTKVGQDTGLSMDTLENNLLSNGATLKEMGFDLTQSINLLAQFEKNGVDASTAMAGLKKAQVNATKNGKSLEDELESEIHLIKVACDDTWALNEATEIFGSKGAAEMTQAIQEGKFTIKGLSADLESYSGVVEKTFEATQDPADEAAVALNNLKLAGADLGAAILELIQPTLTKLVEKIKEFSAWFRKLSPTVKTVIIAVGAFLASIGPVLIAVGKLIVLVGNIMTIWPKLKAAMVAFNATLSANPIGLVIAAIAALVAAFIYLWNNCDEFREFWINLWETIKPYVMEFIDDVKLGFQIIMQWFEDHKEEFKAIWEGIKIILKAVFEWIKKQVQLSIDIFKGIIKFVKDVFAGDWESAWDDIVGVFKKVWEKIVEFAKPPLNGLIALVNGVISGINMMISKINEISIDIPDWVPEIGGASFGLNIPSMATIPYLAKGGTVTNGGSAIVGEAGAEFLHVANGKAVVTPLTDNQRTVGTAQTVNNYINANIANDYDVDRLSTRLAMKQRNAMAAVGG